MEYVTEESLDDSDSLLEGCSLGASEMLDQIVEGRTARNANLNSAHYIPNESVESNDEIPSLSPCRGCSMKKRLQSADSGLESEGNSHHIGLKNDLFQNYCQTSTNGIKKESIVTDNDHFNRSENRTLTCDGLEATSCCDSNHIGLPRLAVSGYVGWGMVDESLYVLESTGSQIEVEIFNQDHYLCKSTQKINDLEVIDQDHLPRPTLVEKFDYVGLEVVDQDHCLPRPVEKVDGNQDNHMLKSTDKYDYVGLEQADQDHFHLPSPPEKFNESNTDIQNHCIPELTENFDYVGLEVVDQDQCLPKLAANFDCGLEMVDQNQLPKLAEKFDYVGLEVVDQNQCLPKSTENVELEVVDQDHYLPRPVEKVDGNYMLKSTDNYDYVGLKLADQDHYHLPLTPEKFDESHIEIKSIQNQCMPKSTEKFGDYIGDHSTSKSTEKFGNYVGLEVAGQDQCVCKSTETFVDGCVKVEIGNQGYNVRSLTEKVDTGDQYCCVSRSTEKLDGYYCGGLEAAVSQNCKTTCYQGRHEGSLTSDGHDGKALLERKHYLRFNDDGYVTSPVLTGQ